MQKRLSPSSPPNQTTPKQHKRESERAGEKCPVPHSDESALFKLRGTAWHQLSLAHAPPRSHPPPVGRRRDGAGHIRHRGNHLPAAPQKARNGDPGAMGTVRPDEGCSSAGGLPRCPGWDRNVRLFKCMCTGPVCAM